MAPSGSPAPATPRPFPAAHVRQAIQAVGAGAAQLKAMPRVAARPGPRGQHPLPARAVTAIQRSCLFDCFKGWSSPKTNTKVESDKVDLLEGPKSDQIDESPAKKSTSHTCGQAVTVQGDYGDSVHGGFVNGCALVFFLETDGFTCYHAPGGQYKSGKSSSYPSAIDYIVSSYALKSKEDALQSYRDQYKQYQSEYGCPLRVYWQEATPHVVVEKNGIQKLTFDIELLTTIS